METAHSLTCVIVDDEPLAAEGLKRQLKSLSFLNILASFNDAIEASSFLETNRVDLLFLDINMPHLNGLSMLKSLSNKPMVIFTTAHRGHALEAFGLDALSYLLKPFSMESLLKAINKAVFMMKAKSLSTLYEHNFIRSDGKYHRLNFADIQYIESKVHMRDGV
jgi:DNA-binding LytR/AlgR family response regulator